MARPIEATPILTGKAAKVFLSRMENNKPNRRPVLDIKKISEDTIRIYAEQTKQK